MPQRNPLPAADVLIELPGQRVVLVRRKNPPEGWAIPGGFIEVGESAEDAAVREAHEETGLRVELVELLSVYSDPARDPRHHTLTVVYIGRACGQPTGGDDAAEAEAFTESTLPSTLAFDHARVLADYFHYRKTGERPTPPPTSGKPPSEADKKFLLTLAREAIRRQAAGLPTMEDANPPPELTRPGGAFVSLHRHGELRGCIGSFARDRPLYRVVHEMALAAAFHDPRFPPVAADEVDTLEIEVSVLSDLRPIRPEQLIPGLHGVSVSLRDLKGVYLPQVASEAGWNRETLLSQTCLKAGLPPDAWEDPEAELSAFTAEVFRESD